MRWPRRPRAPIVEDWHERERARSAAVQHIDFDKGVREIIERTRPYTLTSPERVAALCAAVDYVIRYAIDGPIIECGVWRGGSMMAAALRLLQLGAQHRDLIGYDTFAGMSKPSEFDVDYEGQSWVDWNPAGVADEGATLDDVTANVLSTKYPRERVRFVKGDVEDTLPTHAPANTAIVRLDTDWYSSTRHELMHLYPRLAHGGILIVDDYGHYRGARKAVDEYFSETRVFLHRIDYTGRVVVKQQ